MTLLQSAPVERDRFVSHLYQSRREYRRTCETAGKSGKQIERCVISSFQVAESMGFKGDFRQGVPPADRRLIRSGFRFPLGNMRSVLSEQRRLRGGLASLAGLAVLGSDQTDLNQALDAIRRLRN
jgi:hypothetical protein